MENQPDQDGANLNRRSFLTRASMIGGAALLPLAARAGNNKCDDDQGKITKKDVDILIAAEIPEALPVTTYMNIINGATFFTRLSATDQSYLSAALQEQMSHYLLEESVKGKGKPYTTFYYPPGMFDNAQTTLNTLVTLEDAFIAAYIVGVRDFSTRDLRVTAARIMGIESDHRTLARDIAGDIDPVDGGPLATITGADGVAESIIPANNNGYERTLKWAEISQAVTALTPFVSIQAAAAAGFDTSAGFKFHPFAGHCHRRWVSFIWRLKKDRGSQAARRLYQTAGKKTQLLLLGSGVVVLRMDAIIRELVAEGADADAKELGGVSAVLAGLLQGANDMALFKFVQWQHTVGLRLLRGGGGCGRRGGLAGGRRGSRGAGGGGSG